MRKLENDAIIFSIITCAMCAEQESDAVTLYSIDLDIEFEETVFDLEILSFSSGRNSHA